jgi:hypothetical protein
MGRKSRLKRERRSGEASTDVLDRVEVMTREHLGKISAALLELVKPFRKKDAGLDEMRLLVGFGALAWNLALIGDSPASVLDKLGKDRPELEGCIESLMERKQQLFPRDNRVIASFHVSSTPDGRFHVQAAGLHT